jgi:hypothetical protein
MSVMRRHSAWRLALRTTLVWAAMTVILVVVPDTLSRWINLDLARVLGWAVACGVWVVTVEQAWQQRHHQILVFFVRLILWVSAALVAIGLSDQFRP